MSIKIACDKYRQAEAYIISCSIGLACVGSDCERRKTETKDEREATIDRRRISVEGNGEAVRK